MSSFREDPDDPDRALERWAVQDEERMLARERTDRLYDYTPASRLQTQNGSSGEEGPRVTSAMMALAWTHLHGSRREAQKAGRCLAALILEARE